MESWKNGKTIEPIFHHSSVDDFVKNHKTVTPVKTGVQNPLIYWIPAFAGMTKIERDFS
jgi:hypothetical protein